MLQQTFSDYAQIVQIKPDTPEWAGRNVPAELRELITVIRDSLDETHKHYLKDRTVEQLERHFEKGNLAFGAVDGDGKLIGCVLLSALVHEVEGDFFTQTYGAANLVPGNWGLHTVGVHPKHGGHKLMQSMLAAVETHTTTNPEKFSALVAKVADTNTFSWTNFLNASFIPATQGQDPAGYDYTLYARQVQSDLAYEAGRPFNGTNETAFHAIALRPGSFR